MQHNNNVIAAYTCIASLPHTQTSNLMQRIARHTCTLYDSIASLTRALVCVYIATSVSIAHAQA